MALLFRRCPVKILAGTPVALIKDVHCFTQLSMKLPDRNIILF
jgi:hypothetical protein